MDDCAVDCTTSLSTGIIATLAGLCGLIADYSIYKQGEQKLLGSRWFSFFAPKAFGLRHWFNIYGPALGLLIALLVALEWLIGFFAVPAFLLPRPSQVLAQLIAPQSRIWWHALVTGAQALAGFALGTGVGIGLAITFVHVRPLETALYPWVLASQTIPLVVLAPLLTIWLGPGASARIVLAGLFAFFPILISTVRGLRDVLPEQLDLMRVLGASPSQIFWGLRWPAALPALLGGMKIAVALAVIGVISGELAGAEQGLGFAVRIAAYRLDTARSFAAVVAAALLGLSLHGMLVLSERRLLFWRTD